MARWMSMAACAVAVGVWGSLLLAPQPAAAPPLLTSGPAPGQNVTAVVDWFGGGNGRLRVTVVGLISAGERGAALLSINGAPARAYRVGQTLAPGVKLAAVLPGGVAIDQDGVLEEIDVPRRIAPPQGFVPAPSSNTTLRS